MNKKSKIYLVILSLLPSIVFASNGDFSITIAIFSELFVTLHMSIFVFAPISDLYKEKKLFLKLSIIRICILLFFDLFITTYIAIVDFIMVFIGTFLIVPILTFIKRQADKKIINTKLNCFKCHTLVSDEDIFCPNCGEKLKNIINNTNNNDEFVSSKDFDSMYIKDEDALLAYFLDNKIKSLKATEKDGYLPSEILKKKKIMYIILSLLVFVSISLFFFHVGIIYCIIALIIIFIFFKKTNQYDFLKYLTKEVKSRSEEDIDNIILSIKETFKKDNSKIILLIGVITSFILSIIIYYNPHQIYEKTSSGYVLRFYTVGLTNFKTVEINEKYKRENVVGIRGQVFKNMPFLKSVKLPDTITEIRGQAFENDSSLVEINIPKNLEYLGGSAFKNCKSLKKIELPETLEYIGGECFANNTSLEEINLPSKLTEIRGNTFENNVNLKSITIPDSVTRIGGHAFYNNSSLSEVNISEYSKLESIGSSAFRLCSSLKTITISQFVNVNSRAFKNSPTKVKRYGEVDYGSLIDENDYEYNTFLYLHVGDEEKICGYKKNTLAYLNDSSITLTNINVTNAGNEFTLVYKSNDKTLEFKLNKNESYKIIDENIALEISASYVLSSTTSISLNVYYN